MQTKTYCLLLQYFIDGPLILHGQHGHLPYLLLLGVSEDLLLLLLGQGGHSGHQRLVQ